MERATTGHLEAYQDHDARAEQADDAVLDGVERAVVPGTHARAPEASYLSKRACGRRHGDRDRSIYVPLEERHLESTGDPRARSRARRWQKVIPRAPVAGHDPDALGPRERHWKPCQSSHARNDRGDLEADRGPAAQGVWAQRRLGRAARDQPAAHRADPRGQTVGAPVHLPRPDGRDHRVHPVPREDRHGRRIRLHRPAALRYQRAAGKTCFFHVFDMLNACLTI